MNAVIFGARGQDGYYLARLLADEGITSVSVSRAAGGDWLAGDVTDRALIERLLKEQQPDYIFHLAANSTTRHDALFENHATISTGTLNILEAVKTHSPQTKVFLSGSGLQFENRGEPIAETAPFAATNAYAVARIQSVYAARYFRSFGVRAYVGYFFHHDSPRRGPKHVSQIIAQAARRIGAGSGEMLELGDISVRKEWGFAGDIMRGVWQLVQQDDVFEAVIGTGVAQSIQQWTEACFNVIGKSWKDYVIQKSDFACEYKVLVSHPTLIYSLGWKPVVTMTELARLMVSNDETR